MSTATSATLVTFAPMIGSEAARLLCRFYRIPYREQDYLILLAGAISLLRSGHPSLPLLITPEGKLNGGWDLVRHYDGGLSVGQRLLPDQTALRQQAIADWRLYYDDVGTDVAVYAYFHLLRDRKLMAPIFAQPIPWFEALLMPLLYPLTRMAITAGLKISAQTAAEAAEKLEGALNAIDVRVGDGRRYLLGDHLTLGDIALAATLAPLLQPPGYGTVMPPVVAMPEPLRVFIDKLLGRPAARFVERLYAEDFATWPMAAITP